MKKAGLLITTLCMSSPLFAQAPDAFSDNSVRMEIVTTCRFVIMLAIYTSAVLILVKLLLEYMVKSKILNKDLPEAVVSRLLPARNANKIGDLKWFSLLAAAGIGCLVAYWLRPFGVHSIAIICLSLAAGFLGHHLLSRQNK
jgi:hypothetical protein